MNTIDIRRKSLVLILSCVGWGCGPRPEPASSEHATPSKPADRFDRLYDLAARRFEFADFYKPDPKHEAEPVFAMAPLVVLERASLDAVPSRPSADATSAPVLHYALAEVHLGPVLRRQILFQWQNRIAMRLTISERGFPMIAEIFPSRTGDAPAPRVVFVSRAVEDAAQRQYGPPLPDRRSACEPSIDLVPTVVVAGVFDDPPVPSGPYLYLTDGGNELTTVLCRCSPSQVGDFVGNEYYKLVPLANGDPTGRTASFPDPSPLTELLRLPDALP